MEISENEIHIYQFNLSDDIINDRPRLNYFESLLSSDELAKAKRFHFIKDKIKYISARGFLRILAGSYKNINQEKIIFSYSENGKPFLSENHFKFNLSHSGSKSVYAFTKDTEVGIDIEIKKEIPDAKSIAKNYFSISEISELSKLNGELLNAHFLLCWTRKEAFIKALGEGLSYPLADFSVSISKDKPCILDIKNEQAKINFWELFNIDAGENYISSCAVKAKGMNIIYKNFTNFPK